MQYTSTALSGFEVDLPAAGHEIEEIAERDDLSDQEKQAEFPLFPFPDWECFGGL